MPAVPAERDAGTAWQCHLHYYRMDMLSWAVTAFSPGYRAGTTIPGLKVEPSVPGHRAGIKEGPLVPVGKALQPSEPGAPFSPSWGYQPGLMVHPLVPVGNPNRD